MKKVLPMLQECFYAYLRKEYDAAIKRQDYKIFDDNYVLFPVDKIKEEVGLTAFQQRRLLEILADDALIRVKFGHKRTRYILVCDSDSVYRRVAKSLKKLSYNQLLQVELFIDNL